jgi:hypothetical protein
MMMMMGTIKRSPHYNLKEVYSLATRENNGKQKEGKLQPLGKLQPVDQPTDVLTASTDDAGRVIVGDVGATAMRTTEDEKL